MKRRWKSNQLFLLPCFVLLWLFNVHLPSHAADTLIAGEIMRDWQFLESPNKIFRLLFFVPTFSNKRYLGIQHMYAFDAKFVWVANREKPLMDTSGYVNINIEGNLVINSNNTTSFIINSSKPATNSSNTSLKLLDSGNLVLKAGEEIVWQSFDYPSDTILPGMKFGLFDLKLKEPRNISFNSWQGIGSPYGGAFTLGVDPNNTQQLMIWQRGLPYWRSGNWNGKNFSYFPDSYYDDTNNNFKFDYISNENESYFTYTTLTPYNNSYIEMNSTGAVSFYIAKPDASSITYGSACNDISFGSKGCIKQNYTACSSGEGYFYMPRSGYMDSWDYPEDFSLLGLEDCRAICSKNCKCTAYMSATPDGTGCSFSYGKYVAESFWETFYVRDSAYDAVDDTTKNATRVAPKKSEKKFKRNTPDPILKGGTPRKRKNKNMIVIPLVSIAVLTLACSIGYIIWKKFYSKGKGGSNGKQVCGDTEKYIHELGTSMAAIDKGYAWNLWKDGQSIELLLDAALAETCSTTELKRCVQIALLCVQESASDRPAMSEIVSMIGNDVGILPGPKQPGFYSNYSDTTESTILTYNSISADTTLTNTS
ncbi:hypothetical protein F8388_004586 [Cannabis sativa]|uniref:Uncharacterized protein n=1 Tax=Cannabis sativa TaxID=3483 RepID=A0A7J6GN70_CANSA|nr:hypothetical protein F8388_004586 [Cannabis sativa]